MNVLVKGGLVGEVYSPDDCVEVAIWRNPFKTDCVRAKARLGDTISDILDDNLEPFWRRYAKVWVQTQTGVSEVPFELWGTTRPKRGTAVIVKCLPHGGKNKSVLAIILSMLVMVAAFYLAPVVGAALNIGTKLAFGILSAVGKALVAALIPPPKTNSNAGTVGTQKNFTLTGVSNRAAPFEVVPRVFGRTRLFPPLAAAPYNEIVGTSDVYLRMLFDFGPGPLKITDIKIGDTPITNFQDVQIEVGHTGDLNGNANPAGTYYAGFSDDRDLVLYPNDVNQVGESIKIDKNANIVRSFQINVDEGRVFVAFPKGLIQVSQSTSNPGAKAPWNVIVQAHYREVGTGTWIPMIPSYLAGVVDQSEGGGSGRGVQVFDDTTGEAGYVNATIPPIWNDADYLSRYPTVASNYSIPSGGGNQGQRGVETSFKGLHHYANIGVYEGKTPSWVNGSTGRFIFTDQAEEQIFTQYKTGKLDKTKSYEFKINRYYGYQLAPTGKVFVTEEMWLNTIQSFKADKPVKNVQGHALMALRIRASEQLNGTLQNLSALVEAHLPTWNGSTWVNNVKTRNPAWACISVLKGSARPVADSRIDLATWLSFANWCAANNSKGNPRAMFDGVFDAKLTVQQAIQQILAPQRASFAMKDGKYSVIWDDVQSTPVQLFTPKNSRNFEGRKIYVQPVHALKVRFNNELKNYTEDELTVYSDGYNEATATLFEQIETFGITRPEQAHWFGRYMIATALLRPEVYTLETDIESLVCRRGSLIRVQHDVPRWGVTSGRVRSLTTNAGNVETITLDETFLMEAGKSYAIRGRKADGTLVLANVNGVGVATETQTVTLTTPTAIASMVAVGDLVAFGEVAKETIECVVRNITRLDDIAAKLELLDYAPDVFTSDTESIPDFDTQSTWQGTGIVQSPPTPSIASIVSDETVMLNTPTGYIEACEIRLAELSAAQKGLVRPDDVIEVRYARYRATPLDLGDGQIMQAGRGSWFSPSTKFLGNPQRAKLTQYIRANDSFAFQVRRVTAAGLPSDWSAEVVHTIIGRTTKPATPTGFTAQVRADDVLLYWTQNTEFDVIGYELRKGSTWASAVKVEPTKSPTTSTTQYVLAPMTAGSYTYLLKAIDAIGLEPDTAASVNFSISAPSQPSVSFAYQGGNVVLNWADCQTSHRVAFYRVKRGSDAPIEIKTTSASFAVNWTGSLVFEVWAVDIAGNESAHGSVTVTNTGAAAPGGFTHSIVGETVQLAWSIAAPGSLPVAGYELRYGGADWDAATFIARVTVTTYLLAANWAGARTLRLKAVDTAGNFGTEATRSVNLTNPVALAPTYTLAAGRYTISWPEPSSLLPIKEYEIRYGASWAAGTSVATVKALSISGEVNWTGTRSFWLVARTTTGLESAPTQLDVAITAPAAPSLTAVINGPDLQITWSTPASSLPIARYEIRQGGTDWASATPVAFSDGTIFQTPVTWGGTRTYRVSAIDTSGQVGATASADIVIVAPNGPSPFTSDVVDNNVLLRWTAPSIHTLPIAYYRVKVGATWGGATSIGDKQGTFTSHFQTASGTYKYWIAAVDTAGNEGTPVSLDATVSQPPDYVLKTNFNSALGGTLTNAVLADGAIYMPVNATETFQQHFDNHGSPAWQDPQDQIDAGYTIFIQPTTGSPATYVETYDYGASIPSANITVTPTYETIAGSITWSGRIEVSSNGSSWTDIANPGWTGFATNFRYVKMTVTADGTSDTAVGRLTALNLRIDLKVKRDSGVAACAAGDGGGTTVNFVTDFLDVDSIVVTPRGTTLAIPVVDFTDTANPTSFKILVFDAAGTRLTRDCGWEATGV